MTRLVLFDIDGTLLRTSGVGQDATRIALERVFGTSGNLPAFYPGGRTIEAILFDTLLDAKIRPEFICAGRRLFYAEFIAAFAANIKNGGFSVRPCPGSIELVNALIAQDDLVLGLLTGNHQKTAELKLAAAGYDLASFKIGAYGQEAVDRALLVGLAKDRAFKQVGVHFEPQEIVVLGDTTRDVMAAKDAGVRNIAVTTGTDDYDMLKACKPDFLFEDFEETQAVFNAILG
jgi:phosphoglycolate phosphatase